MPNRRPTKRYTYIIIGLILVLMFLFAYHNDSNSYDRMDECLKDISPKISEEVDAVMSKFKKYPTETEEANEDE